MIHIDLFSGIGGFAYAIDQVWDNTEHIFCDNDSFSREVLSKHWPESEIYHDIKAIDTNSLSERLERVKQKKAQGQPRQPNRTRQNQESQPFILTGGFPCQPFSAAGVRRGTSDDRYLWPEMLRVIRLTEPQWVIAENVRGLLTWNDGLVFEQVCLDLEASGYEVQPFIIPAVAVNAPHRRDRIWFIAHAIERRTNPNATDSSHNQRKSGLGLERQQDQENTQPHLSSQNWQRNWLEVATELCSMDDGFPKGLDRARQLKAYGNAIVPPVAVELLRSIKLSTDLNSSVLT